MPEAVLLSTLDPPPLWPLTLPDPQGDSLTVSSPPRIESHDVLTGPTRLRITARTAPMTFGFECWFTPPQMQAFEQWYRDAAVANDGEFYARWIGGSRVVAFIEPYAYGALGSGYVLRGRVVTTRVDPRACDAYLVLMYGDCYRDDGAAADIYQDDGVSADIYRDDYDLRYMVDHEC